MDTAAGQALAADAVPAAVIATDVRGVVTSWNAYAEQLYGWTAEEAVGVPIMQLTVPDGADAQAETILAEVVEGDAWRGPFTARRKDGSHVQVEVLDAPLTDDDGAIVGIVGVSIPAAWSQWRSIVESSADALSLHDLDGRYRYVSPAFEEMLGRTLDELVGRSPYDLFHPDDLAEIRRLHGSLTDGRAAGVLQYRIQRADQTYIWVETASQVTEDGRAVVAATRRIGARRSMLHALELERDSARRLLEIDAQRRAFLTTIAHRARHPITVVSGMAEVLERTLEGSLDEQSLQLLRRLRARAEELRELIESVTTAQDLTARAAAIDRAPVDLAELVSAVVADFAAPGGAVHVEVPDDSQAFVDRAKLELALRAMLQNAVRHTPIGTSVWVRLEDHASGIVLIVEDDGPGVADDHKRDVFQAFSHESSAHDPSLGLGLYVVAEVAAAHEGRAWIEDRPGGGASVRMLLRLRSLGT